MPKRTNAESSSLEPCEGLPWATGIEEATIPGLTAAYREDRLSVAEVVAAYLARIEAYDRRGPYLNTIVNLDPSAPDEARRLDAHFRKTGTLKGPLHGIPILVKDCIETANLPMTAGFQGWKEYRPSCDAHVIGKLRAAGAVVLGTNSLSEFTMGGGDNVNSVLPGFARNPYNTAHSTGGSSGGTASAIAANFAAVGIGTDTGGSIRMPAAHNAAVGFRPTVGLVSRSGMTPLCFHRDTIGPIGRTVADVAITLAAIAGTDPDDPATYGCEGHVPASLTAALRRDALQGVRLGVLRQVFPPEATDPRILVNFDRTLAELKSAGAVVVDDFRVPEIDGLARSAPTPARRRVEFTQWLARHPGIPYPSVEAIAGSKLAHPLHHALLDAVAAAGPVESDPDTREADRIEAIYKRAFTPAMDEAGIDALVLPVWAQPPLLNGDRNTHLMKPLPSGQPVTGLSSSLTFVASTLQWPAVSVPSGYIGEGLPLGLQIIGRAWSDASLIGYAYAYEQATRHRRQPPSVPPLAPVFRGAGS